MTELVTRELFASNGKRFEVYEVPSDINVITFCTDVYIMGIDKIFRQVKTYKAMTIHHIEGG